MVVYLTYFMYIYYILICVYICRVYMYVCKQTNHSPVVFLSHSKNIPGSVAAISSSNRCVFISTSTGQLVTWNLNGSWFDYRGYSKVSCAIMEALGPCTNAFLPTILILKGGCLIEIHELHELLRIPAPKFVSQRVFSPEK